MVPIFLGGGGGVGGGRVEEADVDGEDVVGRGHSGGSRVAREGRAADAAVHDGEETAPARVGFADEDERGVAFLGYGRGESLHGPAPRTVAVAVGRRSVGASHHGRAERSESADVVGPSAREEM